MRALLVIIKIFLLTFATILTKKVFLKFLYFLPYHLWKLLTSAEFQFNLTFLCIYFMKQIPVKHRTKFLVKNNKNSKFYGRGLTDTPLPTYLSQKRDVLFMAVTWRQEYLLIDFNSNESCFWPLYHFLINPLSRKTLISLFLS